MTDHEIIRGLRNLQTDADLSGNIMASDLLGEAAARILEMSTWARTPLGDLEQKWEEAWNDSLQEGLKAVIQDQIDKVTPAVIEALEAQGIKVARGE